MSDVNQKTVAASDDTHENTQSKNNTIGKLFEVHNEIKYMYVYILA